MSERENRRARYDATARVRHAQSNALSVSDRPRRLPRARRPLRRLTQRMIERRSGYTRNRRERAVGPPPRGRVTRTSGVNEDACTHARRPRRARALLPPVNAENVVSRSNRVDARSDTEREGLSDDECSTKGTTIIGLGNDHRIERAALRNKHCVAPRTL